MQLNFRPSFIVAALAMLTIALFATPSLAISNPIAASGWNVDFILGNGETYGAHQTPENSNIWFAENSTVGSLGLPASGTSTVFGKDFQFQPYTGGASNVLRSNAATNTLTLDTPAKYAEVSVLGSNTGGSGGSPWELTLNFTDGPSTAPIVYSAFGNWAGSGPGLNPRLTSNGSTAGFGGQLNPVTLDLAALGVANQTLSSIDFSNTAGAGGNLAVFALSGKPTPAFPPTIVPIASIDFNNANSPTESGFLPQIDATDTHTTPLGDLTVAVTGRQGNFDRGVPATHGTNTDLYRDFFFQNTGSMIMTLSGDAIEPNTDYELTFYAFDEAQSSTISFEGINSTLGFAGPIISTADADITSIDQFAATEIFTSDGSGVLTFTTNGNRPRINGFEISVLRDANPIPEPASATLAMLGLGGLLMRRRQRSA